jgi:hypothetical protein
MELIADWKWEIKVFVNQSEEEIGSTTWIHWVRA